MSKSICVSCGQKMDYVVVNGRRYNVHQCSYNFVRKRSRHDILDEDNDDEDDHFTLDEAFEILRSLSMEEDD